MLLLLLLVCACSSTGKVTTFDGTVSKVHDGDSIHLMTSSGRVVIRLDGIDAPELRQPFGIESRDRLRAMIYQQRARAQCHKVDKYQRQVCVVFHRRNDINLEMVRAGLAWHFNRYAHEQSAAQRARYSRAEKRARRGRVGLWQQRENMPPWEFRAL